MNPQRYGHCAATLSVMASALVACTGALEPEPRGEVSVAPDALRAAIAECGPALGACSRDAAGDATAQQACRDTFTACVAPTLPEPPVGGGDEDGGRASGGGDGGAHESPVTACIDALLACVMQDGSAKVCAEDVRVCIRASVPAPRGMMPEDPGSQAGDAGMPDDLPEPPAMPDAGMSGDVAPGLPDAGMAGAPPGASCRDAFEACIASGATPMSCGQELKECGRP